MKVSQSPGAGYGPFCAGRNFMKGELSIGVIECPTTALVRDPFVRSSSHTKLVKFCAMAPVQPTASDAK
jgi:hypothetical protein